MQEFQKNGSKIIQNLIDTAVLNGSRKAVVQGKWEVDTAIRIPSDFELILDGCHLIMADNVYENMFVNYNFLTEFGLTKEGCDKNIKVTGINNPILDGGNYNGLSERNHNKDGLPNVRKNIILYFNNVDGFEVDGVHFHNQRYWATCFQYCRYGKITNLHFKANLSSEFEGVKCNYLRLDRYDSMLVRQADGIDIRMGSHDIMIENIHGITGDDSVALTNLPGPNIHGFVNDLSTDMYNITVKHVRTATLAANVRILGQGGGVIHDVLVEDVYDMSAQLHGVSFGLYGVKLNESKNYRERHATSDEMYNITIKDIYSRACYAMYYGGYDVKNLVVENLVPFDGAGLIQDMRAEILAKEKEQSKTK